MAREAGGSAAPADGGGGEGPEAPPEVSMANVKRWLLAEEAAYSSVSSLHMSRCFLMPDLGADGAGCLLSHKELDFFRKYGFLVKKGLLSQERLAEVMELIWQEIESIHPEGQIRRSEPASWVEPGWSSSATPWSGPYRGRAPVFRMKGQGELKLHAFGATQPLLDLVPRAAAVEGVARLLLGKHLRTVERARGVYALFPMEGGNTYLGPHVDKSAQQLNVCAYLDEVPPRGGGFTVWPGSHRLIYQAMELESNFSPRHEAFSQALNRCLEQIVPLELCGKGGDVVFWHGRVVHSAGIHTSRSIRFAAFADFQLQPAEGPEGLLSAEEETVLGQYEWFKDTRLYRRDRRPCHEDMFRNWEMRSDEPEVPPVPVDQTVVEST